MSADAPIDVALVGFNIGRNVPLGLACITAYARAQPDLRGRTRIHIQEHDTHAAPERALYDIVALRPSIVGFNTMHGSLVKAVVVGRWLKQLLPDVRVILGGVEVSPIAAEVLARHPTIDLVVAGEGERAFAGVLRNTLAGRSLHGIAGTVERCDGGIVENPAAPLLDLNDVPSPYLSGLVDVSRYAALHLETFRGCPYACDYCYEGRGFTTVRQFSEARVFEEIEFVLRSGCRDVKFFDTTFNFDRARALRILEYMAARNKGAVCFGAEVRMELFDREMARAAQRAGLRDVEAGLQSLRAATLAGHSRSFDEERFERNLRDAVSEGLNVIVHIMGALPGDRIEDTLAAHDYVVQLGAHPCLFHTRVLPGTPLHERAVREDFVFDSESPYDMIQNPTFPLSDHARYNRFGLARAVIGPYLPAMELIAQHAGVALSGIIEGVAAALDGCPEWQSLQERYLWWRVSADPAFQAEIAKSLGVWQAALRSTLERMAHSHSPRRCVAEAYLQYLFAVERVRHFERDVSPTAYEGCVSIDSVLRPSRDHIVLGADCDLRSIIRGDAPAGESLPASAEWLLIQKTAEGTTTLSINSEMRDFVRCFWDGASVRQAIERYADTPFDRLDPDRVEQLLAIVTELVEDGVLMPQQRHRELARGPRLSLQTLTDEDLLDVARIYAENPAFFTLLTGRSEIPEEYVISEMKEGPAGFEANKYFLGLYVLQTAELAGVADFVVAYPSEGKGCFGLLLLAERHQHKGLGREAAALVEKWALRDHGVHDVTIGVELVNERARRFWRRCGYEPTGEIFTSTALDREHPAEALVKNLTAGSARG